MHGQRPCRRDHPRGVVVPSRARPGDHDQEVAVRGGLPHHLGDPLWVVGLDRQAPRLAPGLPHLLSEHEGIGVEDLPRPGLRSDRPHLVSGREDKDKSLLPNGQVRCPRGRRCRQVDGAEPVSLRQQQLAGAHVLADGPDVLVRGDGGAQFRAARVVVVDVLAHDHRVAAIGHRVAGVHDRVGVRRQPERSGLTRAGRVGGPDRDTVHGRRVERRGGPDGPYRRGGDEAAGFGDRHRDSGQPVGAARGFAGRAPRVQRLGRGHVADERAVRRPVRHGASRKPRRIRHIRRP